MFLYNKCYRTEASQQASIYRQSPKNNSAKKGDPYSSSGVTTAAIQTSSWERWRLHAFVITHLDIFSFLCRASPGWSALWWHPLCVPSHCAQSLHCPPRSRDATFIKQILNYWTVLFPSGCGSLGNPNSLALCGCCDWMFQLEEAQGFEENCQMMQKGGSLSIWNFVCIFSHQCKCFIYLHILKALNLAINNTEIHYMEDHSN